MLSRILAVALLLAGFWCLGQQEGRSQWLLGVGKTTTVAATYTGPGDIVSGASAWWSCAFSYSAAYATGTNNACDLVDSATGLTTYTMKILSNGKADTAGAAGSTACTVACNITRAYDQTGNGRHVTQATLSAMPTLTFSSLGGQPCGSFVRANSQDLASAASFPTITQPFTISTVAQRTGTVTAFQGLLSSTATALGLITHNAANQWDIFSGSLGGFTASDGSYHAVQGIFNGSSSIAEVDGTATTGISAGTSQFSTSPDTVLVGLQSTSFLDGNECEIGVWASGFNSTQYGNMNANAHTRYAF